MALWGKADSIYSPGTVSVNYTTKVVTGSGTSFLAASVGSVITIGAGGTFGQAVISGITSETQVSIATTQYLSGAAIAGVAYTMSQKPIYTLEDSNYNALQTTSTGLTNTIYGVDEYEQASVNATGSKYHSAHAGWVGVHTYVDMHGNLRVKSETLVAMSGISTLDPGTYIAYGDANDDTVLPDRYISFTTQPTSVVGIATTASTSFTALSVATPRSGVSTAWYYAYPVGAAFTALSNDLIYSGVTGPVLGIAATTTSGTRPNGYQFRAVVTSAGGATATSDTVTLTYV
jgi:hypothetical protein